MCGDVQFAELREEDSPDKANEHIEMAIGKSEPIVKVGSYKCTDYIMSFPFHCHLVYIGVTYVGAASDMHAECSQQWFEATPTGLLQESHP